jgi:hypothetical protein
MPQQAVTAQVIVLTQRNSDDESAAPILSPSLKVLI